MENSTLTPVRRWVELSKWLSVFKLSVWVQPKQQQPPSDRCFMQVEDYPRGYPQYSALIAAHDPFHICRRFSNLRIRLLLLKQDEVLVLEKRLSEIDERVLSDIDSALKDYDAFVERNSKTLRYDVARPGDVDSLRNWVDNMGFPASDETEYLECRGNGELVTLATQRGEDPTTRLETWIEKRVIWLCRWFRTRLLSQASRDENVFIFPGGLIPRTARTMVACFFIAILLAPAVICSVALTGLEARTVVVVLATILLVVVLSATTKARAVEIFLAATALVPVSPLPP
ncbi:hypothetical protein B0T26DRAFT_672329 [Lasiosphaeria miniovina]|uniref:DUF6594 domain-containing protein n=1 Tax=Lasiosphaeria miniovina TaxID=1954250 RepID=A0AA40B4Q7_9PEZI|nr:uncharacterized protein B0T26DRAFT_672329 [Lasiosphaeria miniovina]KAK0727691.1 hypothetical protein B0T26DRAFT_672329 [Lasiosphaeria miniovina]